MLRLIIFVIDLFCLLPWWGAIAVLAGLAVGLWAAGKYIVYRLHRDVTAAVLAQGTPLTDALVSVHSVEAAEPPPKSALAGFDPDDESYDPDLDDVDDPQNTHYFTVDATIAPHDPEAVWDPAAVFVVQRDFEPEEELDFCAEMGVIESLEVWRNREFTRHGGEEVTGPQRLRMLLAVPHGLTNAKFAYHFTYFGSLTFPASIALARS
jgi:hypothetical protein